ncbi:MAG: LacI family DNA-binding transcriptional regulator [Oribacterium sp.]|nr:LacI family DNA-binding transcriptional regulator [Oribacterium sp.]
MNLKTIAEMAGVSTATVSNVINGNFGKVSDETRQKIEQIIRKTNYKPNAIARSLAKNESRIIGLIVPYLGENESFLVNPYNPQIIASMEKYIRKREYYLMLRCVGSPSEIIPLLSSWNVDGAIFLGVFDKEVQEIKKLTDVPIVYLDTYASESKIVNVGVEDYRGGYLAAKYLISKGHNRLALVTPEYDGEGVISERHKGFMDACAESRIEFSKDNIYYSDTTYTSAITTGQDIAFNNKGYTAVATMSDVVAFGVIEGLTQCGLRVPTDISVLGFDNLPNCEFVTPKLSTIAQDFDLKAQKACEYLFRMLDGERDLAVNERLPIRVVERQSVRSLLS